MNTEFKEISGLSTSTNRDRKCKAYFNKCLGYDILAKLGSIFIRQESHELQWRMGTGI